MLSLLDFLKKVFPFWKKGALLGIDIGASAIKIVLIEKVDEKVILRNYAEIALGPTAGLATGQATNLSPEKIAEELSGLLKEAKITNAQTYITIPLGASLLSVVELPDVGRRELETMIPIEARRYVPVPLNEVSLDWWILPKSKQETNKVPAIPALEPEADAPEPAKRVEVIIAAIHNEVIKKYQNIKRIAQVSSGPSHFEIEIFSTLRAVVGRDLMPALVLDIGSSSTNLALIDEGVVHASHVISTGGQDITLALAHARGITFAEAEEIKCRVGVLGDNEGRDVLAVADLLFVNIMNEATRFVEGHERKHGTKIAKIILVGGGAKLLGLDKIMEKSFPKIPIVRANPFTQVDSPAFLAKTLKEIGPDFATALGAALKGLE